jgi:hypothetical protein
MNSASNNQQSFYPAANLPVNGVQKPTPPFSPTAVQLQRADDLKRFNRFAVYLPLVIIIVGLLGLMIYLLVIAIWPPYEDTRLFLSGIADIILILFMLPVAAISGLLLAGVFGGAIYWRQSRQEGDQASAQQRRYGRLRLLLWKADQKLSGLYRRLDTLMPKLTTPVISFNVFIAYINAWLTQLRNQFTGHNAE